MLSSSAKPRLARSVAVSPIVAFEILYTAQSRSEFAALEGELDALRQVPLTQGIVGTRAAIAALTRAIKESPTPSHVEEALVSGGGSQVECDQAVDY
jgi:predicted nucleic acid-binding protein